MTADDRAVSEVVGFVISFAMVVTLVGLVYVGGFGALASLAEDEQVNNADRALRAVAENVADIQRGDGPGRAGELRLQEGELRIDEDDAELNVTVVTTSGSRVSVVTVGSLAYRRDGRAVRIESNAVFRNSSFGSAMVREPAFVCDDDRAIVSLVTLRAAENRTSVAGDGSAVVVTRLHSRELHFPTAGDASTDATRVNVTVEASGNPGGWERYFENAPGWTGSGDEYACSASRVYVRETVLAVSFIR